MTGYIVFAIAWTFFGFGLGSAFWGHRNLKLNRDWVKRNSETYDRAFKYGTEHGRWLQVLENITLKMEGK